VARGDTVRIVDNFSLGCPDNLSRVRDHIEILPGDLWSHGLARRAVAGVENVYHFVMPWGSVPKGPLSAPGAGAVSTWHLLLAARDAGCRRMVLASGADVYGRVDSGPVSENAVPVPCTPSARDALLAEQEAVSFTRSYGLGLIRLRFFNVYGPRQGRKAAGPNLRRILEAMLAGSRPILYDHELGLQDMLYVDDAVQGCLLAAECDRADGRVYHISSGRATHAEGMVAILNDMLGTDLAPLLAGPCSNAPRAPLGDPSRACAELGFDPSIDLTEGLQRCVQFYRHEIDERHAQMNGSIVMAG
jgi:UDP-glucose 4-epimerase